MSSEEWPDRHAIRQRRAAFLVKELARLDTSAAETRAARLQRRRAALARANDFHNSQDPRSVAERLGYPSSTDRREDKN